jgi:hypothetical protein
MSRTNLAIRPAVKNSATNWFGPSGWARIATGVHASLPRTTAFAGSSVGDIQMDRGACTPGLWYVWSVSIRCISPSAAMSANIDWYNGASVYLSTSNGPDYDVTGGTTTRVVSGVGLAPTGAATARPNLTGVDGSAQITGLLIEEYASEAAATAALSAHATAAYYFDGDGDGVGNTGAAYAWTGTNGSSTSTTTVGAVPTASVPFGAMGITGLGAPGYPRQRGRAVRGDADRHRADRHRDLRRAARPGPDQGGRAQATVVRVIVYSRPAGTGRWTEVRGGRVAVTAGALERPVDDYEYRGGSAMEYRIRALASAENAPDDIVQTKILTATGIPDVFWLKFIASPYLNRRVKFHRFSTSGAGRRTRPTPCAGAWARSR